MPTLLRHLAAISAVLLGTSLFACGPATPAAQAPTPAERVVPVSLATAASAQVIDPVVLTGVVHPARSVLVSAEGAGVVVDLSATLGVFVQRDETLARLDATVALAQLDQARAHREQARAALELAQAEGGRAEALRDAGALTSRDHEASSIQRRTAEAQVQAADAAVRLADRALQATTVRAPFAGTVSAVLTQVGALVGAGTPAFQLVDLTTAKVAVGVAGREVSRVARGQRVSLRIPALGEREFPGVVAALSPTMDPRTQTWPVEIEVPNADAALLGGMVARVEIVVGEREAIVVPDGALATSGGHDVVFVIVDERAQLRRVELGPTRAGSVELRGGVAAGEVVAVLGSQHLSDGARVVAYAMPAE